MGSSVLIRLPTSVTVEEIHVVNISIQITSLLSIIGCGLNLALIKHEGIQSRPIMKIVIALCVTDIIGCLASSATTIKAFSNFMCQTLGFFMVLGHTSSVLFTCCLAHAYKILRSCQTAKEWEKETSPKINWYLGISATGAAILSVCAIIVNLLQKESEYCTLFHQNGGARDVVVLLFILVIPICCCLYCMYCYGSIVMEQGFGGAGRFLLFFYPLILIVCYLPISIFDILSLLSKVPGSSYLIVVAILINAQGLFNACAYGLFSTLYRNCCRRRSVVTLKDPVVYVIVNSDDLSLDDPNSRRISLV